MAYSPLHFIYNAKNGTTVLSGLIWPVSHSLSAPVLQVTEVGPENILTFQMQNIGHLVLSELF